MSTNFTSSSMNRALAAAVRANVPTLIWGAPGEGKTARLSALAAAWGREIEVVVGSVREPSDFLGMPVEKAGTLGYTTPGFAARLNAAETGILFLDELTTGSRGTMKAMLRLVQERWAGESKLGDHVAIVAAANPVESSVGGIDLDPPTANRWMHLDWDFDRTHWLAGLVSGFDTLVEPSMEALIGAADPSRRAAARGLVAAFLKTRPDLAAPGVPADPVQASKAWPSPRSWSNVVSVLGELDPTDVTARKLVLDGLVGEGISIEFITFAEQMDLIDPRTAVEDPHSVDWSARVDQLFALCLGIEALALGDRTDADLFAKCFAALAVCADKGNPDVAMPSAYSLIRKLPPTVDLAAIDIEVFRELIEQTNALIPLAV